MSILSQRVATIQAAIEVDANGQKLAIDGKGGAISLAAVTAMFARSLSAPNDSWPPDSATVLDGVVIGSEEPAKVVPPVVSGVVGPAESGYPWKACLAPVTNRGVPPVAFLEGILAGIKPMSDSTFEPDSENDIYAALKGVLGDPQDIPTRMAIMCEALRVTGMEESGGDWLCGVDMEKGEGLNRPHSEYETGAFQISQNSLTLDKSGSLAAFLDSRWGAHDVETFIARMKTDIMTCVQFTAMLLRISIQWDGPILSGVVAKNVKPAAVAEWAQILSA
jgi:hypothetical protein